MCVWVAKLQYFIRHVQLNLLLVLAHINTDLNLIN